MRAVLALLLVTACDAPSARRAVAVPLEVLPVGPELADGGLTVTLDEARLALRTVRFREPAPVAWLDVLVPTALAHPGHEPAAGVVGEWLGPVAVDLVVGGGLGDATVYEGAVERAEAVLDGIVVAGTAHLGDRSVPFRFVVDEELEVLGMDAALAVDADAPPAGWALTIDLAGVLGELPWAEAPTAGTWDLADPAVRNTFLFRLERSTGWTWASR